MIEAGACDWWINLSFAWYSAELSTSAWRSLRRAKVRYKISNSEVGVKIICTLTNFGLSNVTL